MKFYTADWHGRAAREWRTRTYLLAYTLVFALCAFTVFFTFIYTQRSFVWERDGIDQHAKALSFVAQLIQDAVRGLLETGHLELPAYSFALGYGADVLTTLHYYVIGDPFTLLALPFPVEMVGIVYTATVIARLYAAGLAFSLLCRKLGCPLGLGVLTAALVYTFCGYSLCWSVRHLYFINPMVYLPLLLLGVEQVLGKQRPYLFIGMVFIATVSNFYFLYMLAVFTILYIVVRLVMVHGKNLRAGLAAFGVFALYAATGILLGCVVLFPVMLRLFDDPRAVGGEGTPLLYTAGHYRQLAESLLVLKDGGKSTLVYSAPVGLVCMMHLLTVKGGRDGRALKVGVAVLAAMLCLPFFGKALNGFSYVANRWTWAWALLVALVVAKTLPAVLQASRRRLAAYGIAMVAAYTALAAQAAATGSAGAGELASYGLLAVLAVAPLAWAAARRKARTPRTRTARALACCMGCTVAALAVASFMFYWGSAKHMHECVRAEQVAAKAATEEGSFVAEQVQAQNAEGFFRVSADRSASNNFALLHGLSSTRYYWSLSSSTVQDYFDGIDISNLQVYNYKGLDARTMSEELASVRYYLSCEQDSPVPFGYEPIARKDGMVLYENTMPLPLGYTYETVMSQQAYEALSPLEKQAALMQAAVLEDAGASGNAETPQATEMPDDQGLVFPKVETVTGDGVKQDGSSFIVGKRNATVTLRFSGLAKAETYLCLSGLRTEKIRDTMFTKHIRVQAKAGVTSTENIVPFVREGYRYYHDDHDFTVNLGYAQDPCTQVTLTFPLKGTYTYDELRICCQSFSTYRASVERLAQDTFENAELGADEVRGSISLDRPKVLCLSIPFSSGWSATVDGHDATLYRAQGMYLGLALDAGEHEVTLHYETPGKAAGNALALVGAVALAGTALLHERRRKSLL